MMELRKLSTCFIEFLDACTVIGFLSYFLRDDETMKILLDSNHCSTSIIKPEGNFSLIVESESLETLGLNRLRRIVKSNVYLKAPSLCLANTINWYDLMMLSSVLDLFPIIDSRNMIKIEQQNKADECGKTIYLDFLTVSYESIKVELLKREKGLFVMKFVTDVGL